MSVDLRPRSAISLRRPTVVAVRPAIATAALAGVVVFGVLICVHAAAGRSGLIPASWHGLPGWMAGPLPGAGARLTGSLFAGLFVAMSACYLLALALARHVNPRAAMGTIVLLHVLFMLAPPLLSADVFGYLDWARIGAVHGLDPYSHGSLSAPHDPVFAYMRWRTHLPSPYGPLFTLSTYALTPLSVPAAFWVLKAVAAAAGLAIVWLVRDCARRLAIRPTPAAMLVGLNPLVLAWAVAGAHNDLVVTAVVMAGVWLAVANRDRAAGATFAIGTAVKISAGVMLPFLIARRAPSGDARRNALTGALIAGAAAIALAFAAFGTGVLGMLTAQRNQQNLVATSSLPNQVGRWLGFGGITPAIRAIALVAFAAVLVVLLVRTWRGMNWIAASGWATLAMLATSAWIMPWYVLWVLPLAALSRDRRLVAGALALCAFLVVMRTPL